MKCLRCGYCCIQYTVVIVDDPSKGIVEDNLIVKETGQRCKHLTGNKPGEFSCAIHNYSWYEETPCYRHGQIETSADKSCRLGAFLLNKPEVLQSYCEVE